MTRPINKAAREQEVRVQEAVAGLKSGIYKSTRAAAKACNIPRSTLRYRAAGRETRWDAHVDDQLLSGEEEKELVHWIGRLTASGYPPKLQTIREMAEAMRTRRVIGINEPTCIYIPYDPIGEQWPRRFLNRHSELATIIPESIEAIRIKETSAAVIQNWFDQYASLIQTHNIQPQDIYNMDETGFSIGSIKATRVVIDKTKRSRYSAQPGRQEWVSIIECISEDGSAIPPLMIFKGKTLSRQWLPSNTPKDWIFSCNTQGWTSNEHCKKWLTEAFEPYTKAKAEGRPRLLIFDGHGSHTTSDIVLHCLKNNIHLALLPPHSSHLTQPLDIGVFSSMKAHMATELDRFFKTGIPRLQKAEWVQAFIAAREQAFMKKNILSGWSGTGLHPFNPAKVLGRIPIPPPSGNEPHTPPQQYDAPLLQSDLNSSPVDTPLLRAANTCITARALDRSANFDTPARNHVVRMTRTINRSLARNRILSTQLSELQDVISSRKQRQTGKQPILRGKVIIATMETFDQLQKAEQATEARRPKKQKVGTHLVTPTPAATNAAVLMEDENLNSDDEGLD